MESRATTHFKTIDFFLIRIHFGGIRGIFFWKRRIHPSFAISVQNFVESLPWNKIIQNEIITKYQMEMNHFLKSYLNFQLTLKPEHLYYLVKRNNLPRFDISSDTMRAPRLLTDKRTLTTCHYTKSTTMTWPFDFPLLLPMPSPSPLQLLCSFPLIVNILLCSKSTVLCVCLFVSLVCFVYLCVGSFVFAIFWLCTPRQFYFHLIHQKIGVPKQKQ